MLQVRNIQKELNELIKAKFVFDEEITSLVIVLKFDLYFGPVSKEFYEEEFADLAGKKEYKKYDFVKFCKILKKKFEDNITDLYVDLDANYVSEKSPEDDPQNYYNTKTEEYCEKQSDIYDENVEYHGSENTYLIKSEEIWEHLFGRDLGSQLRSFA